jgi:hypothetical protein
VVSLFAAARSEAVMGNKDRARRDTKKTASRSLKEKRAAKKAKKTGGTGTAKPL